MSWLGATRAILALLLVVAAGSWMGALFASSRSASPALLVYAEPVGLRGASFPLRVVAVWPSEKRRAAFRGVVVPPAGEPVPLVDGVARLTLPSDGDALTLRIEGDADGVPASTSVTVALRASLPAAPLPRYQPWTAELASGSVEDRAQAPVYPAAGRQPAMLPGEVVVVSDAGIELVALVPNAAGTRLPDGRALRLDKSGVVIEVPPVLTRGQALDVVVRSAGPERLHLDLVVNGGVRDMRILEVGSDPATLKLPLPEDARAGWFAVHAATSPLGNARGAVALGLLVDEELALSPRALIRRLAAHPSFQAANDPLLARLWSSATTPPPVPSETFLRALLARLHVDHVRAANLAPSVSSQAALADEVRRESAARFRLPFRVAGGLFALLAAVVALRSVLANQRWRAESDGAGGRQLAPAAWSLLAFAVSLSALWVLDWVIGLMLNSPPL